jgi:hypothetical protein
MTIDEKGNVGVGTLENVGAKLDVDGDSRFRGPLTVDKLQSGPSLTVVGTAEIAETLSIGEDLRVNGKVEVGSLRVGRSPCQTRSE